MSHELLNQALIMPFCNTEAIAVGIDTILLTGNSGESWKPITYRSWPAPVTYLFLVAALAFLIPAAKPFPPMVRVRTIADTLASDSPLEAGDPDPLNFGSIAAGLSRFLRNRKTEPPLTIAVTGDYPSDKPHPLPQGAASRQVELRQDVMNVVFYRTFAAMCPASGFL